VPLHVGSEATGAGYSERQLARPCEVIVVTPLPEPVEIGARVRLIRRRRGLSLDVAAGLAGISKPYLSQLETGQRYFNRRGLLEDLARALGCSVADLTGQPYLPPNRGSADALATLPGIRVALHDYGPDDVPDVVPRSLDALVSWAERADDHRDHSRYSMAGNDLGTLITELHVHAVTAGVPERPRAVTAFVRACVLASRIARRVGGNLDLAGTAARRGYDMACRHDDPGLTGFARWEWALQLMYLGARHRVSAVLTAGIDELGPAAQLRGTDTLPAQMLGFMHLVQAWTAARDQRGDDAHAHLDEAGEIARRTGECNGMRMHFGPTNVAVWRLGADIELCEGGRAYEQAIRTPLDVDALGSAERSSSLHFYLARALTQETGAHDADAIRHLDTADRLAPQPVRNDALARDLVRELDLRAKRQVWELDSLKNRFGF